MAKTPNSAITPQTPKSWTAQNNNTAYTGTLTAPTGTGLVTLATGSLDGDRITSLKLTPFQANTTAVRVDLWRKVGSSFFPINSAVMPVVSLGATKIDPVDFGYSENNPLLLNPNEQLVLGAAGVASFVADAQGASY